MFLLISSLVRVGGRLFQTRRLTAMELLSAKLLWVAYTVEQRTCCYRRPKWTCVAVGDKANTSVMYVGTWSHTMPDVGFTNSAIPDLKSQDICPMPRYSCPATNVGYRHQFGLLPLVAGKGVDPEGWEAWVAPLKICKRVHVWTPWNGTFFHSKLLLHNSPSITSSRMKELC